MLDTILNAVQNDQTIQQQFPHIQLIQCGKLDLDILYTIQTPTNYTVDRFSAGMPIDGVPVYTNTVRIGSIDFRNHAIEMWSTNATKIGYSIEYTDPAILDRIIHRINEMITTWNKKATEFDLTQQSPRLVVSE